MSATGDTPRSTTPEAPAAGSAGVDPREAAAIREVLVLTPGVQSVGEVVIHRHVAPRSLVTAVLGFGPSYGSVHRCRGRPAAR